MPTKKPARVLPLRPPPPEELTDAQLHARVLDRPARRRAPEDEVSIRELERVLALPWATEEPAEPEPKRTAPPQRSRLTRRPAVAAMERRRREVPAPPDSGPGSEGEPITHGTRDTSDRCYKMCRCAKCGAVAQCTPGFDFFGDEDQPLLCSDCCGAYGANNLPKRARAAPAPAPRGGGP